MAGSCRAAAIGMVFCFGALATTGHAQLRYDDEYEGISYRPELWADPVAALVNRIDAGEVELRADGPSRYLTSFLLALDVPLESQSLVFTKTSLQQRLISPATPRAIYFNDDVYVAWTQGSRALEITAVDPTVGPVFYTLTQLEGEPPVIEPKTFMCLRCHDSYSLTGGGVPRFLMGSMIPGPDGEQISHEGWSLTSQSTPIDERWGGWYVTGTHGEARHRGNLFLESAEAFTQLDLSAGANVTHLSEHVDLAPYPDEHSDIVALLVLEHQVQVQNLMTRVSFDARTLLARSARDGMTPEAIDGELEEMIEPLMLAMLFVDEVGFDAPIRGTSGFTDAFTARGVAASDGRSLRDFDLERRLFRYPLSYLIHSSLFESLPEQVKLVFERRLQGVLQGSESNVTFGQLSEEDRRAIREILMDTTSSGMVVAPQRE